MTQQREQLEITLDHEGTPIIRIRHQDKSTLLREKTLGVFVKAAKEGGRLVLRNTAGMVDTSGNSWEDYEIRILPPKAAPKKTKRKKVSMMVEFNDVGLPSPFVIDNPTVIPNTGDYFDCAWEDYLTPEDTAKVRLFQDDGSTGYFICIRELITHTKVGEYVRIILCTEDYFKVAYPNTLPHEHQEI